MYKVSAGFLELGVSAKPPLYKKGGFLHYLTPFVHFAFCTIALTSIFTHKVSAKTPINIIALSALTKKVSAKLVQPLVEKNELVQKFKRTFNTYLNELLINHVNLIIPSFPLETQQTTPTGEVARNCGYVFYQNSFLPPSKGCVATLSLSVEKPNFGGKQ